MNPVFGPALLAAVILLLALAAGALLGFLAARARTRALIDAATAQSGHAAQLELAQVRERLRAAQEDVGALRAERDQARTQGNGWRDELDVARDEGARLAERASRVDTLEAEVTQLAALHETAGRELARRDAELVAEREGAAEKLRLLTDAKTALSDQFRSLAGDILEEKAKRFAEQNQQNLGTLLDPLRTQLNEFKGKVEEVYVQEGKDRSALAEQVRQLMALNQTLSRDAANLTSALKGSAKTQGNWGELILERVLEASGLRKGHEYHVQDSQRTEDGRLQQPDVVIDLPEQRKIVVDAKVSLVAYDRFAGAATDDERVAAARAHLDSVRSHVRGLSDKRYQVLYGLKSLDMVVMFVPIEPAFMLAVSNDETLFMEAWQRNVLLVSPSTLLFVVRTIAHLWRQEAQSRNAQQIATRGAELYDKLAAFVADLQRVGAKLKDAQSAYDDAEKRLATGKGNVIRQAEMLRTLGVKTGKTLPGNLVEAADAGDDEAGASPETLPVFDAPAAEPPSMQ